MSKNRILSIHDCGVIKGQVSSGSTSLVPSPRPRFIQPAGRQRKFWCFVVSPEGVQELLSIRKKASCPKEGLPPGLPTLVSEIRLGWDPILSPYRAEGIEWARSELTSLDMAVGKGGRKWCGMELIRAKLVGLQ